MRRRRGSGRGRMAGSAKLSELGRADNRVGQFVALALALCVGATSAALAADLPAPPPVYYKEPPIVYNWTGFYIGGNIGAAWSGLSGYKFFRHDRQHLYGANQRSVYGRRPIRRELPVLGRRRHRRRGDVRLASRRPSTLSRHGN